jgi:hypothetical protein
LFKRTVVAVMSSDSLRQCRSQTFDLRLNFRHGLNLTKLIYLSRQRVHG